MVEAAAMGESGGSLLIVCTEVVLALSGGLLLSLLGPLDDFDLVGEQLHELLFGEISSLEGGEECLSRGERRDRVGGLGLSLGGLLLLLGKAILEEDRELHELVGKMELLDELVVWLRLRLLHGLLLLVPVDERDPLGSGHLILIIRQDEEVIELEVGTKVEHILELHEAGIALSGHVSKG